MIVFVIVWIALCLPVILYADRNLHRDERMMKKVWKAGYAEKQAVLPNGTVINFGEGGAGNATPLLLLRNSAALRFRPCASNGARLWTSFAQR